MSNDRPENPTQNQAGDIALDDMGIPILKEIVAPKADPEPEAKAPVQISSEDIKRSLSPPNNEILLKALKNLLRSKIENNLDDIAKNVATDVISSISQDLEQKIKSQLTHILEQNLDAMINQAITEISNRK